MEFGNLTAFLDKITAWRVPGCVCRINIGGEDVYEYHCGYSNIEKKIPMNGSELFYLYSLTKLVTCTCALQLYEKGEFLMSDPLSDYLPEYANMKVRHRRENGIFTLLDAKRPITIRDLFTMTAGFTYNHCSKSLTEIKERTHGECGTRDIIRALADEPLEYEPGEIFRYSLCHDVLGAVIEEISSMTLGEYMKKNIFDPLDMKDTFFRLPEEKKSRMMEQYSFDRNTETVKNIGLNNEHTMTKNYESGGAGLISNAADYMKFASALCNFGAAYNGARLLSPRTIELMRTNHLTPHQRSGLDWIQLDGYGYGLGVRTHTEPTISESLSPLGEFGWSGMAGTYVLIDPENKLTIMYGEQMVNSQEPYIHPRIRNIVYASLDKGE